MTDTMNRLVIGNSLIVDVIGLQCAVAVLICIGVVAGRVLYAYTRDKAATWAGTEQA